MSERSTQAGAPVIDWDEDYAAEYGAEQEWRFLPLGVESDGEPEYFIVNQNSGQCLTTDGVAGDQLYQWPCGEYGSEQQVWATNLNPSNAGGLFTIRSVSSGLYVDLKGWNPFLGASIDAWPSTGGANQVFYAAD